MTTKVICVTNQKGGVGKTTTAVSLGHGLALRGKDVLLIDLDPQGHSAVALGMEPEPGAFYLLTMGTGKTETDFIQQYVHPTGREHLALLAGSPETMAAQTVLNAQPRAVQSPVFENRLLALLKMVGITSSSIQLPVWAAFRNAPFGRRTWC